MRPWKTRLYDKYLALELSHQLFSYCGLKIPIYATEFGYTLLLSLNLQITLHSAYVLEHDIVAYFLTLQEIWLEPRKIANSPVDRLVYIKKALTHGDLVIFVFD